MRIGKLTDEQLESLVQTTDKEREACSIKAGDVFITRTSETMDEIGTKIYSKSKRSNC